MSPQPPPSDWIVPPAPFSGRIELVEYDPAWPGQYEAVAARIRAAIGDAAVVLEHAGSTSVPGLAAKPVIDVVLGVPDATAEAAYVPALESAGFEFAIREPEWYEHRLFRGRDPKVNLHTFSADCEEVARMLAFRDWMRSRPEDRDLYEGEKRRLAEQPWDTVQDYADAKTEVVREIIARALAANVTDVHGDDSGDHRP
jgi:GrpB-like predicted nucleotidyltransferase (UPF0157 family)